MARNDDQETPEKTGRIAQIRQTYKMARRSDRWVGWITLGILLGVLALAVVVGIFVGPLWLWIIVGLPIALLGAAIVFGRRAERAAYSQIEGQPGAAAAALGTLRRGWETTPMVGANRYQDVVHRAVGRPGIVLIGEGSVPGRVANLLAQEKKRHSRVAPEMPVVEVIVGREEGQVPLPRLTRHLNKLPKNIRPAEVTELRARLRALGSTPIGIPKGPLPKGARIPRGTQMPGR
ncbi:DUF4191 domain-containing protein [Jiangella alba]|uniref:DUF4191 domain-containing protein n=1 Tax=Jiangella alba TaxID=561176 RepID=A0A1H5K866_9ACTN|nr:DUF4191 domain-containing protein [Jiangella alba]SEE60201.1 protein of unknown function [Jiangella alba]